MFKDIDLSKDAMAMFRQSAKHRDVAPAGNDVEINVSVLTTGFWPQYTPMELNIPPELAVHCENFKSFYLAKHQGRRLNFQNTLGTCVVKTAFSKGVKKELSLSLFQTIILLLFNSADTVSLKDILEK